VHGITISKLEAEMGFGSSTIRKWATSAPSVDKLKKVADYFGVTVDELLKEETEQKGGAT
jgi:transcriptional regulator with XRE-family HTH domain